MNKEWIKIEQKMDGASWLSKKHRLFVISSTAIEEDKKKWQHVSVTRVDGKMPTYDDLKLTKKEFIGDDKSAIQVFPKKEKHVNIHATCLHLWSCEVEILPDFTGGSGSL